LERDDAAFAAGREAARADVAAGRFIYRWSGHAGHWGHYIVTQLRERFGVNVDDGFGICMVTASRVSFNDGYNGVLAAEIDSRFGSGAFESVFVEARSQSEERLADARHAWLEQKRVRTKK
jgi:hypothetical protein